MNANLLAVTVLMLGLVSGTIQANVINLDSQPGLSNTKTSATVAITPNSAWQANHPVNPGNAADHSAVWISYALTGYGDPHFQPYMGTTPVVSIFDNFVSGAGVLHLNVWADDTAQVFLDGISLINPKFTQSTCSGQPIGCVPADVGVLSHALTAGSHTLEFAVYQTGTGTSTTTNPFGLLFTGTATAPDPVPEPGTLLLAGAVLVAAGLIRKRRQPRA